MKKIGPRTLRGALLTSSAFAVLLAAGGTWSVAEAADPPSVPRYAVEDRIAALEEELQNLKNTYVRRGKRQVELTVSGQVNRGVLFADDGQETETFFVDNDNSSTRVRWVGKAKINDYWSAGAQIEVQIESNSTAAVNVNTPDSGNVGFTQRKMEFWLDRKFGDNARGRLWVGHGDMASNGTSEQDLSGTGVVAYSGVSDLAGGMIFRNAATGAFTGNRVGNVFSNLDGLSREDRIRGDITVGPVKLSASTGSEDEADIAVFFKQTVGDTFKIAAAAAYATDRDGSSANEAGGNERNGEFSQYNGSVSILHVNSGISLTGAAGVRDIDDANPATDFDPVTAGIQGPEKRTFYYAKLAIERDIFEIGSTAAAVDYFMTEDARVNGDEGKSYGIAVVQNIDAAAMEIYAAARRYEYDDPVLIAAGQSAGDVDAVLVGGRVKF